MRRPFAVLTAVLASFLAAVPAAAAQDGPHTETASAGAVSATLETTMLSPAQAGSVRLTIVREGQTVLAGVSLGDLCDGCEGAYPIGVGGGDPSSLVIRDLTGDGEPEVLVDLYTGGAHCCSVTAIYGWDTATSTYRSTVRFWGDPGYRIADAKGGGGPELVSADGRFAYAFCAYVCSGMPVQVFRYRDFGLVDVTRERPGRVRADLRRLRGSIREIRRAPRDERFTLKGLLPALCADLYLLRRGAQCRAELRRALRRGELARQEVDLAPSGRRYVRSVLRFLHTTGYR
jgi:hypothetical protein